MQNFCRQIIRPPHFPLLLFLALGFLSFFPNRIQAAASPKTYPYRVTTTVGMVTDIVRQVAGDKAAVKGIMGSGVDPHLYKPTRDDVAALMRADVVFYSGLMLEGKMTDILVKLARTKPVHAVTELIDEKYLLTPEEMQGHYDPHVWMDPSAWAKAVQAVGLALSEYDPGNADSYRKNAAALAEACMAMHAYGQKVLSTIPEQSRVLISSHDAFNYFGRAFGLKVIGVQGISTESEAGLQRINHLTDFIIQNAVKAVFVESSVPRKTSKRWCKESKPGARTCAWAGNSSRTRWARTAPMKGRIWACSTTTSPPWPGPWVDKSRSVG